MKFKSNARFNEPLENGTIFELKDNGLRIKIHRIVHIDNTWFLSCPVLGFSQTDLHESDFEEAIKKAKSILNSRIDEFREEFNKIVNDDVVEIVKY